MIERLLETMILRLHATACYARWHWRIVENSRQIQASTLPVIDGGLGIEHVDAAYHFVHTAEAEVGHISPHLFREKEKEIDDVFRLSLKLLAQHGILRGDSDRA